MIILGIDPGLKKGKDGGGLALLTATGLKLVPMPLLSGGGLDLATISDLVRGWAPTRVFIESLSLIPTAMGNRKGYAGAIRGAAGWGKLVGLLTEQGKTPIEVAPKDWQRWHGISVPRTKKAAQGLGPVDEARIAAWGSPKADRHTLLKAACVERARYLFPGISFLATARSTVPHTGLCDASLIAAYGRHVH